MRVFLRTFSTNEDYNADCDYAVVDLTPELAELGLSRIENLKRRRARDSKLFETAFEDASSQYFSNFDAFDEILDPRSGHTVVDILWGGDPWIDPDHCGIPEYAFKATESDSMMVQLNGVYWEAFPKHGDVRIYTAAIPLSLLQRAVKATAAESSH